MMVPRWRAHAVVATLGLGGLLLVTNETLPFGLINVIADDVGRSQSQIGLLVTGYAVVIMAASVPLAIITRSIPRRYVLAATFAVWTAGVVAAALSDSYGSLLVARVLTALAQAQYWAVSAATVAGLFPPGERGKAVSRMLIGPAAAAVVGLPPLTALGLETSW